MADTRLHTLSQTDISTASTGQAFDYLMLDELAYHPLKLYLSGDHYATYSLPYIGSNQLVTKFSKTLTQLCTSKGVQRSGVILENIAQINSSRCHAPLEICDYHACAQA